MVLTVFHRAKQRAVTASSDSAAIFKGHPKEYLRIKYKLLRHYFCVIRDSKTYPALHLVMSDF